MAQAPQHDGEGGQTQVGLGLTTAGREEEQVDDLAMGMVRIAEAGEVQQDEGQLERPPPWRPVPSGPSRCRRARATARLAILKASRASGSLSEELDAALDTSGSDAGQTQQFLCGRPTVGIARS